MGPIDPPPWIHSANVSSDLKVFYLDILYFLQNIVQMQTFIVRSHQEILENEVVFLVKYFFLEILNIFLISVH